MPRRRGGPPGPPLPGGGPPGRGGGPPSGPPAPGIGGKPPGREGGSGVPPPPVTGGGTLGLAGASGAPPPPVTGGGTLGLAGAETGGRDGVGGPPSGLVPRMKGCVRQGVAEAEGIQHVCARGKEGPGWGTSGTRSLLGAVRLGNVSEFGRRWKIGEWVERKSSFHFHVAWATRGKANE